MRKLHGLLIFLLMVFGLSTSVAAATAPLQLGVLQGEGPPAKALADDLADHLGRPVVVRVFEDEATLFLWLERFREIDLALTTASGLSRRPAGANHRLGQVPTTYALGSRVLSGHWGVPSDVLAKTRAFLGEAVKLASDSSVLTSRKKEHQAGVTSVAAPADNAASLPVVQQTPLDLKETQRQVAEDAKNIKTVQIEAAEPLSAETPVKPVVGPRSAVEQPVPAGVSKADVRLPDEKIVYLVPFTSVMIPERVEIRLQEQYERMLQTQDQLPRVKFVRLDRPFAQCDPEWLRGRHRIIGEVFGYLEKSGHFSTRLQIRGRLYFLPEKEVEPEWKKELSVKVSFNPDISSVANAQDRLADALSAVLTKVSLSEISL